MSNVGNTPKHVENTHHSSCIRDFSISGNEYHLQHILSKLKFISKIKSQEKINTIDLFVREPGWHSSFMRTLNPDETRDQTLKFLETTVQSAIDLYLFYRNCRDEFNNRLAAVLRESLEESKKGLRCTCITYSEDRMYVSKIETLIEMINAKNY